MLKSKSRRRVACTLAIVTAILVALPSSSQAFKWGKNGDRARVERPNSAKDDVPIAEPKNRPASSVPRPATPPAPAPVPPAGFVPTQIPDQSLYQTGQNGPQRM